MEEITDVLPFRQGLADERGADFEHGGSHQTHLRRKRRSVYRIAGTRIDKDGIFRHEAVGVIPAGKGKPVVRTDNQVESNRRISLFQLLKGVDGIGGPGKMKLEVRRTELGIILYGQPHQLQTEFIGHQVLPHLERIAGCDEKPKLVQPLELSQVISQRQMPNVDGVERTAEDTYVHTFLYLFFYFLPAQGLPSRDGVEQTDNQHQQHAYPDGHVIVIEMNRTYDHRAYRKDGVDDDWDTFDDRELLFVPI